MSRHTKVEIETALLRLRQICPPGTRVYTVLRHVARSGMRRMIDVFIVQDNRPVRIAWDVALVVGRKYEPRHEAIRSDAVGEDAGFELVHALSYALHGMQDKGIEGTAPWYGVDPGPAMYRAGYSLKHYWL